tara:strand:+ start:393 stop:605 length:213 start_codon:yes stop_codon:yes gene_type:complete
MERERFGRDREREMGSSPSFSVEEPKPKATESEESKPAKSFLKDFVDKIPTPVQDAIDEKFGTIIGRVER